MTPRRLAPATITAALVAIVVATAAPDLTPAEPTFACVICGDTGVADIIANVILFGPLGVGLAFAGVRLRHAVLAGALLSGVIEVSQLVIPGRDPSVGDLIANTLGAWAGFWLTRLVPALARMDDRTAARLSVAAALDVALVVLGTGWLLRPSYPGEGYWSQLAPRLPHLEWYRARVLDARLAGAQLRTGRIPDRRWARAVLLAGAAIEVRAIAGPRVPSLGALFNIYGDGAQEVVLLGPDRDDLVYRYRPRAADFRLDQPDVRLPGAMRDVAAGDSLVVRAWSPRAGEYCLGTSVASRCGLGYTAGTGWAFIFFMAAFPAWLRDVLRVGWMAAVVLPCGFFVRRRWESTAALAALVVALAILPALAALRPTGIVDWLGAGTGLAVGAMGSRLARATAIRGRGIAAALQKIV